MALPISQNRAGGNSPGNLFATATEFTPKPIKAKEQVINTSFITQAVPSVHRYAGVVALCAVPKERADMNDLGWHIANFLAFRALLCGENPPKAQTWLSQCDIAALVEKNPEQFIHGKDKRLVGVAAKSTTYKRAGVVVDREDNIQVETSAENLRDKFIQAVKEKMEIVKQRGYPLLIIICGLTTLEQDVYFGKLDIDHRCTMGEMRQAFGNGINDIDVIVVTASIFSAGWHINPTFGRFHDTSVRANRTELLARQFGGLFAKELVESFLGWKCPVLDVNRIDEQIRLSERFPGPAKPSSEVKELISKLQIKIQSCLVGQLSASHMDHSFSFDETKDEWSILVGHRERSAEYQSLNEYELKWNKLPTAQHIGVAKEQLKFLGNAFGGSKISQMNHIKYLIEESFQAWPDHWASSFGQETKRDLERFLMQENPEELDCHEIFNVLEHRAATSVLADMIVGYFDLPVPHNQRCRDWDYLHWRDETSGADRSALINNFGTVLNCVPGPNVPPGVNPNMFSKIQRRLESAANYIRASLGIRFLTSQDTGKAAIDRIHMCM
ncbi:hypothetical protein F5Y19DRAFT_334541 [Xylariaceae sp. FL1651]|nr:hypothetical protein F5Y19DRAFT_334541 [Xylariaceae sp. FL1651]